jgi:predicted AlkP superfamily phosphohydrolase/phosphomutase
MNFPRTLVIGIDGATFDLIKPWAQAGLLPTFAHLLQNGAHATLVAYPYMNSAAAWTNIVTGYNPGQHGIFSFTTRPLEPINWRAVTGHDRHKPAFWHTLTAAGQRAGVMNVPMSFPAETLNGFMLSGMDSPSATAKNFSHPQGLFQELRRAGIEYVIDVPNLSESARHGEQGLPPMVRDMTVARTRAFLYLLEKYPCDTAMLVYIGNDRMSHHFWNETPPAPDAPEWRPLRELFQLYDSQLQELLQPMTGETTVFLVSDHGFGAVRAGSYGGNALLERAGYQARLTRPLKSSLLSKLLKVGRRTIPQTWQRDLAGRFPTMHARAARAERGYDWTRTRAYIQGEIGAIRFNLRGRDPDGIVTPEESESLRNELKEFMLGLTNPESGAKIVKGVDRGSELMHGPFVRGAGELYINWNYDTLRDSLAYHRNGEDVVVTASPPSSGWIGTHRSEGIFIAYGKGIRPGVTHEPISHFELTPTLLYLHDQPVADDMDGRVLTEWFEPDFVQQHSLKKASASDYTPAAGNLDNAENEMVETRLRQLGYIE